MQCTQSLSNLGAMVKTVICAFAKIMLVYLSCILPDEHHQEDRNSKRHKDPVSHIPIKQDVLCTHGADRCCFNKGSTYQPGRMIVGHS